MKKLSDKEYKKLGGELHFINPLFGEMWKSYERMVFDPEIETSGLTIHNNNFQIVANPRFWKKCNTYKKWFVICHEMCHVMFGHWLINDKLDAEWANIAQDIQINEFLIHHYPIFRQHITKSKNCATIEYVFKHKANVVEKFRDYKYYYGLIMKCLPAK